MIGAAGGADGTGVDLGGSGINIDPNPGAGTSASGGTPGASGTSAAGSEAQTTLPALKDPGCACRQGPAQHDTPFASLGLFVLGLLGLRRRERSGRARFWS
jgi:MYXO-CTERM domain-containing protein